MCADLTPQALMSSFLIYSERLKTTQVYVREVSVVSPMALLLFGGALSRVASTLVMEEGWIQFAVAPSTGELILSLRTQLDRLLAEKIRDPTLNFHSSDLVDVAEAPGTVAAADAQVPPSASIVDAGRKTLAAIVTLLTTEKETRATLPAAPLPPLSAAAPNGRPGTSAGSAALPAAAAAAAAPLHALDAPLPPSALARAAAAAGWGQRPASAPAPAAAAGKGKGKGGAAAPAPKKVFVSAEAAWAAKVRAAKLKRGELSDDD